MKRSNSVNVLIRYLQLFKQYFQHWIYSIKEYNHLKKLFENAKRTTSLGNKTIVFNTVKKLRGYF